MLHFKITPALIYIFILIIITKLVIIVKYVLFNWNDKESFILKAIELAKEANVDFLSFWPTKSPLWGTSFRYYFTNSFKKIGMQDWRGRVVNISDLSNIQN